jgi:cobalt/nickel transport system permease protein
MTGALLTSIQLWLSGTSDLQIVIPAMLWVHALIGVGEALITVFALGFIMQTRPDLLGEGSESAKASQVWVWVGGAIALAVVLFSPLASTDPDGLNRVASDLGFINNAQSGSGPFAGYSIPFLASASLSKIAAGALGIIVVGIVVVLIGRGMKAKTNS